MHTAELSKNSNILEKSIQKYFSPFIRGLDGFESWKKNGGQRFRDTLALNFMSRLHISIEYKKDTYDSQIFACSEILKFSDNIQYIKE